MKKFFNNLRGNRFLPFIIIIVLIVILAVINVITSKTKKEYSKSDIVFNFEDTTEDSYEEINSSTELEETYIEDTNYDEYIEDTENDTENDTDLIEESVISDSDINMSNSEDIEDNDVDEPILFNSNKFLENTALGYLNQTTKYRQFFKSKEVFESRNELPISNVKIVSSDLNTNTVTIKYIPDGELDEKVTGNLKFIVENNKVVEVKLE